MVIAGTDSVLTDTEAYILLPAELISGPIVDRSSLSPAGRNVAVLRKIQRISAANISTPARPNPSRPIKEQELIFWNAAIRKPVLLWQSAQPATTVSLSEWLPDTESLFALIDTELPANPQQPEEPPATAM